MWPWLSYLVSDLDCIRRSGCSDTLHARETFDIKPKTVNGVNNNEHYISAKVAYLIYLRELSVACLHTTIFCSKLHRM